MPGRGLGERLAVDPKLPNIIYFGARSGNGLWKCEPSVYFYDFLGVSEFTDGQLPTMERLGPKSLASPGPVCVLISVPDSKPFILHTSGTYIQDPSDPDGYANDIVGISWVTFDSTYGTAGSATPRIFVGVANLGAESVFVSNDAGATCETILQFLESYILTSHRERCPWSTNSVHPP